MMTFQQILDLVHAYSAELPPAPPALAYPTDQTLAGWIDHTILKPEATGEQVKTLCAEARQFGFAAVCVNPVYVPLVAALLSGSAVKVCSVVSFPLGTTPLVNKVQETRTAVQHGAQEIDMVLNVGALKSGTPQMAFEDVRAVVEEAHAGNAQVKVILETCLLTREEKILASLLCKEAGADFVKTSTGFGAGGATVEDVDLMRRVVGAQVGVKASGGIRTLADARAMLDAGANRLGMSAGVKILQELEQGA
jgi:deoxyribose-phosphate aldolase